MPGETVRITAESGYYKKRGNFRPNPNGRKFNENADDGPGGDRRPRRGNFHGPKLADDGHNRRARDREEKPNRQHKTVAESLSELNFSHLRVTDKAHIISKIPDGHGCTIIGVRTPEGEMRSSMKYDRELMLALSHSPYSISQPDEFLKIVKDNEELLPPFPQRYIPLEFISNNTLPILAPPAAAVPQTITESAS